MSSEVFDGQILAEKLSKLNNSQQSIESLSRWCISHRKKAGHIVETWDKFFNSSQRERRVSFLYLANDILQNSRRKGSEFVNEFWKVLPAALKHVYEKGDEHGKKVVSRLVDIWEERKVFGSRGQGLKDDMLGKNPPSLSVNNGKSSNPIKIVKRDAQSVRIKLAVGGLPEKILTAFQSVLDEDLNEEAALNKSNAAVSHVDKIMEDVESTPILGNQNDSALVDELQEQENVLQQCIAQLENAEAIRAVLVSQLKEALQDQESKLQLIHAQLQVSRSQMEQASHVKMRLTSPNVSGPMNTTILRVTESVRVGEHNTPPIQPTGTPSLPPLAQPAVSFAPMKTTDEESKKAAAAAMAAKLAASASSAQMLTSVLSSLVAEEAASMNNNLKSTGFTSGLPMFPPEKRAKLEKSVAEVSNSEVGNTSYFTHLQEQQGIGAPPMPSSMSMQPMSQIQASFGALPPLPHPPHMSPVNPQANQYVQSAGMVAGVMSYGYGTNALPPPPPLPPHITMGLARPASQPSQLSQPQQSHQQQQQQPPAPATGGYYRPPGIGFYGQNHQAATPPVPRQ